MCDIQFEAPFKCSDKFSKLWRQSHFMVKAKGVKRAYPLCKNSQKLVRMKACIIKIAGLKYWCAPQNTRTWQARKHYTKYSLKIAKKICTRKSPQKMR